MTKQEKQLLLIDLCARLPYGIKIKLGKYTATVCEVTRNYFCTEGSGEKCYSIDLYKPYLRPMSSMTEDEICDYMKLRFEDSIDIRNAKHSCNNSVSAIVDGDYIRYWYNEMVTNKTIDFLNEKMFDWRGLIPMGLALEASKDMYK